MEHHFKRQRILTLSMVGLLAVFSSACQSTKKASPQAATRPAPIAVAKPKPTPAAPAINRYALAPKRSIAPSAWKDETFKWLGTPYAYGGMSRQGVDCSGFVTLIYRTVAGITLPRTSYQQFNLGTSIHPSNVEPGDLVFFRSPTSINVGHVGISLGGDDFIHASTKYGVIVSSLTESYYARQFLGVKRILP